MIHRESQREALTLLTRLAQRPSEADARFLAIALRGRESGLAEVVVDVALETGDPVGRVLAAALEALPEPGPDTLQRLERRFRDPLVLYAIPLQELALTVLRQLLRIRRATWSEPDEAQSVRLGLMLNDLSHAFLNSGRRRDAVEAAEEAVRELRRLDGQRSVPFLASCLETLAVALNEVGRLEEAVAAD